MTCVRVSGRTFCYCLAVGCAGITHRLKKKIYIYTYMYILLYVVLLLFLVVFTHVIYIVTKQGIQSMFSLQRFVSFLVTTLYVIKITPTNLVGGCRTHSCISLVTKDDDGPATALDYVIGQCLFSSMTNSRISLAIKDDDWHVQLLLTTS